MQINKNPLYFLYDSLHDMFRLETGPQTQSNNTVIVGATVVTRTFEAKCIYEPLIPKLQQALK